MSSIIKAFKGHKSPGHYNSLADKAQSVLAESFFEGAQITSEKVLSKQLQLRHTLSLNSRGASYNFGSVYAGDSFLLTGTADNTGNVSARVNWVPAAAILLKGAADAAQGRLNARGEAIVKGPDFVASGLVSRAGRIGSVSYLQSVSEGLDLGFEVVHVADKRVTMHSLGARYTTDATVSTLQVNSEDTAALTHTSRLGTRAAAALKFGLNRKTLETEVAGGVTVTYPSGATVSSQVGSSGKMVSTVRHAVAPGVMLEVCGAGSWAKRLFSFGVGIVLSDSR
eukprot:gnl/Dysnectes_brevis/4038_a5276_622.p1 GENE.gnl/Dysnectes_brevis/4038_a5276_622~~gnl/Dysnectes_brevis/4038_a5276_622.p1  ORF type:complete len:282 (+),score=90.70 gnl/Dysnectes_brevis/4038_a5276_622:37-882(+)